MLLGDFAFFLRRSLPGGNVILPVIYQTLLKFALFYGSKFKISLFEEEILLNNERRKTEKNGCDKERESGV